mmetsp:Transcript_93957/g.265762  ORF Transcript_93957/g.265762 Transcript_93957/m.265762 type:complete len:249 (-) Transcript_93957:967-1713(-)
MRSRQEPPGVAPPSPLAFELKKRGGPSLFSSVLARLPDSPPPPPKRQDDPPLPFSSPPPKRSAPPLLCERSVGAPDLRDSPPPGVAAVGVAPARMLPILSQGSSFWDWDALLPAVGVCPSASDRRFPIMAHSACSFAEVFVPTDSSVCLPFSHGGVTALSLRRTTEAASASSFMRSSFSAAPSRRWLLCCRIRCSRLCSSEYTWACWAILASSSSSNSSPCSCNAFSPFISCSRLLLLPIRESRFLIW